jgi:FYVE zinc finger/WW domain
MSSANPAAQQGWVKSVDPKSGRTFYANRLTRKTQWDKPDNWIEEQVLAPPPNPYQQSRQDDDDDLPANWEMMHDPTTGKPFYVDHERKITTWTKPTAQKTTPAAISHAPATVAASSSSLQKILSQSATTSAPLRYGSSTSSYHASSSYYEETYAQPHQWHQEQVDFSDSMPTLEFSVKKVEDALRPNCSHCEEAFTMSKRRHHCRLCGDVFCDPCSSHRVNLPLEGPEFEKPVRVCDFCNQDIEKGNFFSLRRYFTPILLYKPGQHSADQDEGVASAANVNAAIAALTSDFDQMLNNPTTSMSDKVTIPPDVFVPALVEHLYSRDTADRTVRAIASLLALESVAGKKEYAHAIFLYGGKRAMESIMELLERSGSDRRTLFIQEQAARAIFYLTEGKIVSSLARKHEELSAKGGHEFGGVESIDLSRALRNMLDHCSVSKNPNLQRWSASAIHHLVLEDQRRATMAVNEVAAAVASGQAPGDLEYKSFLDQLVSTGGVMILCSLIGEEDADTRAHAVAACQAILSSTRIMDNSRAALAEMTGGQPGGSETKDGAIVRALVAGGACGSAVSQLLISADNAVAGMGCDFVASLVGPLLSQAAATASLPSQYDWRNDNDGMGACREAALEIVTGSCLPALLSLVRAHARRPVKLKQSAMESLAAVVLAVGEIGRAWAAGKYEEGLERAGSPAKLKEALLLLNEEGTIDVALELLQSTEAQSLGSTADTPASRMRECAGIILASLTSCSAEAIMELQTRKVVSPLLLASNDASMMSPSTIRGDTAPRCLGVLETVASVLMFAWQHPSGASNELLDQLIEALDVGAISFLSKVLSNGVEWDSKDKAVGGMKSCTACFRMLCCLFGIALTDETAIGMKRLMDAVDSDSYSYNNSRNQRGPHNIVEAVLGSLQVASSNAKKALMGSLGQGAHYQTALMDMLEAAVLATGSMCGSSVAPGGGEGTLIKGVSCSYSMPNLIKLVRYF